MCVAVAEAKRHLQRSRLSQLPAPLGSASLQALLANRAHCCRCCLLTLTANNVLLDDCALLKPERSQRLMMRSRKWRRMNDTDAGPCPCREKWPKADCTQVVKSTGICVGLFPLCCPLTRRRWHWEKEECFHCVSAGPNSSPADRVLCQEDASCWC